MLGVSSVDHGAQTLATARHFAALIERSLGAAKTLKDRPELVHRTLLALVDAEVLHQREPGGPTTRGWPTHLRPGKRDATSIEFYRPSSVLLAKTRSRYGGRSVANVPVINAFLS